MPVSQTKRSSIFQPSKFIYFVQLLSGYFAHARLPLKVVWERTSHVYIHSKFELLMCHSTKFFSFLICYPQSFSLIHTRVSYALYLVKHTSCDILCLLKYYSFIVHRCMIKTLIILINHIRRNTLLLAKQLFSLWPLY